MVAFRRLAAFLVLALMAAPALAQQHPRVALVIGNSRYETANTLPNPDDDAEAIAAAFDRLGFSVTLALDADYEVMRSALQAFSTAAIGAEFAIVFYAGHGMELGGINYLIPTDARLQNETDLLFEAIPLNSVVASVRPASVLSLIILDACRDNPFAARLQAADPTRNINRGLGDIEPAGATLVAYAARDGTVARDGPEGGHSPFTAALLRHIETPGLEVQFLFREVRDEVLANTSRLQEPWLYGTLGGDPIYLNPAATDVAIAVPPPTPTPMPAPLPAAPAANEMTIAFNAAAAIDTIAGWQAFLTHYPTGVFADLARAAIARLDKTATAPPRTTTPPPTPPPAATPTPVTPAPAPATPAAGGPGCWDHNGSVMRLTAEGTRRVFAYEIPRPGLASLVSRGTILFDGIRVGETYTGQSRIFSSVCNAQTYRVEGPVSADQLRVTLYGSRQILNACQPTGQIANDVLVFTYLGACATITQGR